VKISCFDYGQRIVRTLPSTRRDGVIEGREL
jgi:hypothetical protein